MIVKVTWKIEGQKTERTSWVPEGEAVAEWIGQKWAVEPESIVVVRVEE